ncbi:hypothetical protein WN51_08490 [Melipona quadrifasciata]|uniref:Uncharacterized protein n=1 Tax=Melipona quadrifasciata TaxID=166423 RepID=A0A0N0BJ60_9HYME|nr:hypothetical protein WN51_08490 [Melipona quadrifasciata]
MASVKVALLQYVRLITNLLFHQLLKASQTHLAKRTRQVSNFDKGKFYYLEDIISQEILLFKRKIWRRGLPLSSVSLREKNFTNYSVTKFDKQSIL